MRFNLATSLAAAGVAIALAPAVARAAEPPAFVNFTNGSFESPGGPDNTRAALDPGGDTTVTGWTNTGAFQIYEASNQDGLAASDGDFYVSFGHLGTAGGQLSQSFSTILGDLYTVDYDIAIQQGEDHDTSFLVSVTDGGGLNAFVSSGVPGFNAWSAGATLRFTGTGGLVTLTFTDATDLDAGGGGGGNLALDNVRLTDTGAPGGGVPEPASWALLIVGFGGGGAMLRAKRRLSRAGA